MKKLIGFGTQFYTLWNYEKRLKYVTDAYGKHHISGYNEIFTYIKNISKDIDKVKKLYPNVDIDEGLRGIERSWERVNDMKLPEGYFWFGRYKGSLIDEVIKIDFDYCLWAKENVYGVKEYIEKHPKYLEYIKKIDDEKQAILSKHTLLKEGDVVDLLFTTNGRSIYSSSISDIVGLGFDHPDVINSFYVNAEYDGIDVRVFIDQAVPVGLNSRYPYLMPVINGKAQKTKNKTIKVKIIEVKETKIDGDVVWQNVKI